MRKRTARESDPERSRQANQDEPAMRRQGSKSIGRRDKVCPREHVKVKYLYVQDLVKAREVEVSRVPTETNLADIGTKHWPGHRLDFLKSFMGKSSENAMTFREDTREQYDESDGNSDDGQHG